MTSIDPDVLARARELYADAPWKADPWREAVQTLAHFAQAERDRALEEAAMIVEASYGKALCHPAADIRALKSGGRG